VGFVGDLGAAVRRAVRDGLAGLPVPYRGAPVLVACSGGADSVALAAAAVAVRGRDAVHGAVVDHGLQDGSAERAAATAELLDGLGIRATVHRVEVTGKGGVEAAARRARYAALRAARPHPDSPVLLGHTLDDQAETVLLGLARGSGIRSLSGMAAVTGAGRYRRPFLQIDRQTARKACMVQAETVLLGLGRGSGARSLAGMRAWDAPWCRPLLGVRRAVTRAACTAAGLPVWDDPHNTDPRFTRVRLRHEVLPLLEDVLAGGVAEALARTARQLREDGEALDAVAADLLARDHDPGGGLAVSSLDGVPAALRRRVLRAWLATADVTALTEEHLRAADVLAGRGPDRGGVALPGGLELVRAHGRLSLRPIRWHPG
jgi:tRNA(Ile)-lysidine synthase